MNSTARRIIFVGAIVVVAWLLVNLLPLTMGQMLTGFGDLLVIFETVVILVIVSVFRHFLPRLRFKKEFGLTAPKDAVEINFLRAIVDDRLSELAGRLDIACKEESKFQSSTPRTINDFKARRDLLTESKKAVKKAKKAFWSIHKLAEQGGVPVKGKHTDYLSGV